MKNSRFEVCQFCVMDTTDPDIVFTENKTCNHCDGYQQKVNSQLIPLDRNTAMLSSLADEIKIHSKKKEYNCVIGISGGVDSTYVALLAKDLKLTPILVHFDNGWNSDISVRNIKNTAKKTGFDLFTYVVDWDEFRDIQRSLFKSSVIDIEMATDHAIKATLYAIAKKFRVNYILSGGNVITEAIMPSSWRHIKIDKKNIVDIHKQFGSVKLKTYPFLGILKKQLYKKFLGINEVQILNYVRFNREEVVDKLIKELDWMPYGGKHHESVFTRFYQGVILPRKFNVDKRKCHYSNLICSGQMTREGALTLLKEPAYEERLQKEDEVFVMKKLGFEKGEFEEYISLPRVEHEYYKSDQNLIDTLLNVRNKIRLVS